MDSSSLAEPEPLSSEEAFLQSFERFYKAINKLTRKDANSTSPLPSCDSILREGHGLNDEASAQLKEVWRRAERLAEVHRVVKEFHNYRSTVRKKLMHKSHSSQLSGSAESGIKDIIRTQTHLEQQLHFSNAMLVGMEQRWDLIPDLIKRTVAQQDSNPGFERLEKIVGENQRRLERMEDMMKELNCKLGHVSADPGWPEAVHNNIVYSSASGCGSMTSSTGSPPRDNANKTEITEPSAIKKSLPSSDFVDEFCEDAERVRRNILTSKLGNNALVDILPMDSEKDIDFMSSEI